MPVTVALNDGRCKMVSVPTAPAIMVPVPAAPAMMVSQCCHDAIMTLFRCRPITVIRSLPFLMTVGVYGSTYAAVYTRNMCSVTAGPAVITAVIMAVIFKARSCTRLYPIQIASYMCVHSCIRILFVLDFPPKYNFKNYPIPGTYTLFSTY